MWCLSALNYLECENLHLNQGEEKGVDEDLFREQLGTADGLLLYREKTHP